MSEPRPELSVVVPCFGEEAGIAACVEALAAAAPGAELLVVDGGHDRTGAIVGELARDLPRLRYVPNHPDRGKGHAVRTGVAAARGRAIAQFDADLQFSAEDVPKAAAPVLAGEADLVLGSRHLGEGRAALPGHALRDLGNRVVSAWAVALAGHPFSDVLAGVKAWSPEAFARIDPRSDGFSYEVELPLVALRRGLRVGGLRRPADRRQQGPRRAARRPHPLRHRALLGPAAFGVEAPARGAPGGTLTYSSPSSRAASPSPSSSSSQA